MSLWVSAKPRYSTFQYTDLNAKNGLCFPLLLRKEEVGSKGHSERAGHAQRPPTLLIYVTDLQQLVFLYFFYALIGIHFYFPSLFLSRKSQKPQHSFPVTLGLLIVSLKLPLGPCSCLPPSIAKHMVFSLYLPYGSCQDFQLSCLVVFCQTLMKLPRSFHFSLF